MKVNSAYVWELLKLVWFCLEATTSTDKSPAEALLYVSAGASCCFPGEVVSRGYLVELKDKDYSFSLFLTRDL